MSDPTATVARPRWRILLDRALLALCLLFLVSAAVNIGIVLYAVFTT